jgi:hypothetical protein
VQRLDGRDRRDPPALAPGQELDDGAGIGAAGVRVADRGGEEFQEAELRALAGDRDECWEVSWFGDRDELIQGCASPPRPRSPKR